MRRLIAESIAVTIFLPQMGYPLTPAFGAFQGGGETIFR